MTKITKMMCLYQLNETNTNLFVCENPEPRKCIRCKKQYIPTNKDISSRRPSCYWKQCATCRVYMQKRNEKKIIT
jgi:hypothetical protein